MRFAHRRGVEMEPPWVAQGARRMLWVVLPVVNPGRTMLLLCPCRAPSAIQRQAGGVLIERVCEHFAARGVHLAQVMLEPSQREIGELYQSHGFVPMADLVYLERDLHDTPPLPARSAGYRWRTYSAATHDLFAEAIKQSYRGSLDCPPLNGLREVEDTIAGHKATGKFDPAWWFVLSEGDISLGVLLLSRAAQSGQAELVYLGLAPEARGRGLGDLLMVQAMAVAARDGLRRLTLAVDAGNLPAMHLYHRHGFHRVSTRRALLRNLRSMACASSPRG